MNILVLTSSIGLLAPMLALYQYTKRRVKYTTPSWILLAFLVTAFLTSLHLHSSFDYEEDNWELSSPLLKADLVAIVMSSVACVLWGFHTGCHPWTILGFVLVHAMLFLWLRHMWFHSKTREDLARCKWFHGVALHLFPGITLAYLITQCR